MNDHLASAHKNKILEILGSTIPGLGFYQLTVTTDGKRTFTYLSALFNALTQYSNEEIYQDSSLLYNSISPESRTLLETEEANHLKNSQAFVGEIKFTDKEGNIRWGLLNSFPDKKADGRVIWDGVVQDITNQKKAELKIIKTNHELHILNSINDLIINEADEIQLFQKVCKNLVESGSYMLAWICLQPDLDNIFIQSVASYGKTEYLDEIVIDLSDEEMRKGPTASALINGKSCVTNNVEVSENFAPWLAHARKFGIASSMVIPIILNNKELGAINVYSSNINAFDAHESGILERIAKNLSLAVKHLRTTEENIHTRNLLQERIKELRTIYQVNKLLLEEDLSFDELLDAIVQILPSGWHYTEICAAQIEFRGRKYTSPGYSETLFKQEAIIYIGQQEKGKISIAYAEERPLQEEGPFLKEERELLNSIAESIQIHWNKQVAHDNLQKSQANLKSVFDHTEVGYVLIDLKFQILSYNQKMYQGYANQTGIKLVENKSYIDLLLPEKKKKMESILHQIRESGLPVEYETQYVHNENTVFFNINVVPIKSSTHEIIGFCISAYDISKRKSLEAERQSINHDLIQRNRDLEQFAFIVSHNLRAPLANIMGLVQLFKAEIDPENKEKALIGLEISTDRLDTVVKDLNTILQVKREISEIREYLELPKMIEAIQTSLAFSIRENNVTIETDFSAENRILSIQSYLTSIFLNLITNSIKYAQPKRNPHIRIRTERSATHLIIHYRDNGIGINLTKHGSEVFGLYKRFHPMIEGKGIGLFMVKTQVEVMGGTIEVKSQPNEGTEFILSFPIG